MPIPIDLPKVFYFSSGLCDLAIRHFNIARNKDGVPYRHYYLPQRVVDNGFSQHDSLIGLEVSFDLLDSKTTPGLFFPGTIGYKNRNMRKQKTNLANKKGFRLVSFIHPSFIGNVDHQAGLWIMENVVIQDYTSIGTGCVICPNVTISHNSILGDFSWVSPGATICGNVDIEEECFIGAGAIISNGVRIGKDSIIGAGATITRDVEPNSVYGSGRNYKLDITADKVHLK